jgi:FixJ family two-component response regulator
MDGARKKYIAIIDDDQLVREGLTDCLESAEYSVEAFDSAEAFLRSDAARLAACLILDVQLPGMTGLELQDKLAEVSEGAPIVFVTAHSTDANRERAIRQGAAGFLSKPFRREELLKSIKTALHRRGNV